MAGRTVLTDPLLADTVGLLRRVVPLPDPATWADVDLVLICHLHGDHLHLPSLRTVGPGARVVVPRGAGGWLRGRGFPRVDELSRRRGDRRRRAADHRRPRRAQRPPLGPALHPRPGHRSLGHLIEGGGVTVYASGDTGLFDGMAGLPSAPSTSRCCRSGAGAPTSGPATWTRRAPPTRWR